MVYTVFKFASQILAKASELFNQGKVWTHHYTHIVYSLTLCLSLLSTEELWLSIYGSIVGINGFYKDSMDTQCFTMYSH